jgi:hypothetical protein
MVRERLATSSPKRLADIKRAVVRPITLAQARSLILPYEWLGCMAAVSRYAFGIFFNGELGGAVVYGDEYAANLGVWDRYGYGGRTVAPAPTGRTSTRPAS